MVNYGILVVGAESSGTRLLARILTMGGCQGTDAHMQPFDTMRRLPQAMGKPLMWRRSLPHAHEWPDLRDLIDHIKDAGYRPALLHTLRDMLPSYLSQVAHNHVNEYDRAHHHIIRANRSILEFAEDNYVDYHHVTYAGLCSHPRDTIRWLWNLYGLDDSLLDEAVAMVNDQDAKRWSESG